MASQFTQLSPGVDFTEIDLTNIVGNAGASGGAFVGNFAWGPVDQITTISSPLELESQFGKPDNINYIDWFSAFNFLSYTGNLQLVRVIDANAANATDTGTPLVIKNRDHFEIVNSSSTGVMFASRFPGELANGIEVHVADSATFAGWKHRGLFDFAPSTSASAAAVGAHNDEIHAVVVDALGRFTGVPGAVLETYAFLSKAVDAKDSNNAPAYYVNVINRTSQYVWALDVPAGADVTDPSTGSLDTITITDGGTNYATAPTVVISAPNVPGGTQATATCTIDAGVVDSITITNAGSGYTSPPTVTFDGASDTAAEATATLGVIPNGQPIGTRMVTSAGPSAYVSLVAPVDVTLTGGADSTAITADELIPGYNHFENAEEVDVSLIFTGHAGGDSEHAAVCQHVIDNIAERRRDCIVFMSPRLSDVLNKTQSLATNDIIATRDRIGRASSYAVMDSGWKLQYDVYNDTYRWIPLNADIAGLCAHVDNSFDPWISPGGYNRGRIRNVVSLAYSPNKTARDAIYKVGINPVVTFRTDGTILYGDKTMQGKNSAFSQIGIRRLFILLQKTITNAAKYFLFDQNNAFTRSQFLNMVTPYLSEVRGRGGIDDFRVVCDETNNTPQTIMNRQFIGDIYIKPTYSVNYIQLNFIAVRQDVDFDEIIGATF